MTEATSSSIKVWDPLVRMGHWTLVAAFFTAYFTEDDFLDQHVWAGYVVGVVICLRIVWGFIGTRHARFGDFLRRPSVVVGYLRDLLRGRAGHYVGHNPAGGVMIIALMLGLLGTTWSGLMIYAIEEKAGPLAGYVASMPSAPSFENSDDDRHELGHEEHPGEEFWEETHEFLANLTLLLVILHITGVVVSSRLEKQNLVKAMITGRKPNPQG